MLRMASVSARMLTMRLLADGWKLYLSYVWVHRRHCHSFEHVTDIPKSRKTGKACGGGGKRELCPSSYLTDRYDLTFDSSAECAASRESSLHNIITKLSLDVKKTKYKTQGR